MDLVDQSGTKYLKQLMSYLSKNYPIKKKGVKIQIKLVPTRWVPFKDKKTGIVIPAEATFGVHKGITHIKIAVGDIEKTPKDIMHDLIHEYQHCLQYHNMNCDFSVAASSYLEDPREIEANEFAERVLEEYLSALE